MVSNLLRLFVSLLIVLTVAGCRSQTQPSQFPAPVVQFWLDPNSLLVPVERESVPRERELLLSILGIYAVDKNIAFLYGELYGGTISGSVLLRTDDAGKSWQEMMKPSSRQRTRYVVFGDRDIGWAFIEDYWGEPGGPLFVYKTEDMGLTWQPLARLSMKTRYWELVNANVSSPERMELQLYDYEHYQCTTDCLRTFATLDGGLTWSETDRVALPNGSLGSAVESHEQIGFDCPTRGEGEYWQFACSTGRDGSFWQFRKESDAYDKIAVERKLADGDLEVVSVMSAYWLSRTGKPSDANR